MEREMYLEGGTSPFVPLLSKDISNKDNPSSTQYIFPFIFKSEIFKHLTGELQGWLSRAMHCLHYIFINSLNLK